jgi:hypothetical protein
MTIDISNIFSLDEKLNQAILTTFIKAIKESNMAGMDYLKFKQSVKNLMAMNMDEATSFKSAFATATTLGLSKEELIKSIYYYEKVINDKRDEFIDAMKNSIAAKVEEPKQEIIDYQNSIIKMEKEIEILKQKIELTRQKIETSSEQVVISEEKIENTRKEFLAVYEAFMVKLKDDKDNFEKML